MPAFTLEDDDIRNAFRIIPYPYETIEIKLPNGTVEIVDISASGLSFINSGYHAGDRLDISFLLPTRANHIDAQIEIVVIDKQGVCHCRFTIVSESNEDAIHHYVLCRQKKEIRNS